MWIGKFYDAALRCFGEMVEVRQNCVNQSGRFAFSKIQNNTFQETIIYSLLHLLKALSAF